LTVQRGEVGGPKIRPQARPGAAPGDDGAGEQEHRLNIDGLTAWYSAHKAIADIDLGIQPNSVTAFIGPSGCGKSTLLRCINRMHEVNTGARVSGKVELDGKNIYGPDVDPVRVRRQIGMVFQQPNPFPTMSIRDNVVAGLKLTGVRDRRRLDEIAERSLRQAALWDEVKDKLRAPGTAISGGQQQRLCIARALAVNPEIVLMDEPASALDPIATSRIEDLMVELKRDYTIIVVTHNMQQAARVSDYTAFLLADEGRTGRLVEYGPTNEIFTAPKDKRTEDYITGRFG
jgi:phosphate transport system ATP-binding protein